MHPISDIWFAWSCAAVFLVGIRLASDRWYARVEKRKAVERSGRAYQHLMDDLVVGNATITEDQWGVFIQADSEAEAASALYDHLCKPIRAA